MKSIETLLDQYDRGRITRRSLVQALAMLALPTNVLGKHTPGVLGQDAPADSAPIVRGLGVNHVGLLVTDVERSYAFYHRLFGVRKGWPAKDSGPGIHLDFPSGYISVVPAREGRGSITHFSIAIDRIDQGSADKLADKINSELPDAQAKAAFQANDGVSTVNLIDPDGCHVQISPKNGR